MSWSTFEDAVHRWVRDSSGLEHEKVIWAEQLNLRPEGETFISIRIGDLIPLGAYDRVDRKTDLTKPNGEEIEHRAVGERSVRVTIQCFSPEVVGEGTAREVLSRVQTSLSLPLTRGRLVDAGFSPYDIGRVRNISAILAVNFEARSVLEVGFYVNEVVIERGGYIKSVEGEDQVNIPPKPFVVTS